jgi:hypothetical protein
VHIIWQRGQQWCDFPGRQSAIANARVIDIKGQVWSVGRPCTERDDGVTYQRWLGGFAPIRFHLKGGDHQLFMQQDAILTLFPARSNDLGPEILF